MNISKVSESNQDVVSQIYMNSWKTAYENILPKTYLEKLTAQRWLPLFADDSTVDFVLEDHQKLVATASISLARDEAMLGWGELISLYVLPQYFRKGYGERLFTHCIEYLQKSGYEQVYVWVLEENVQARSFYEKNGFFPSSDTSTITYNDKQFTKIRYVNTLI